MFYRRIDNALAFSDGETDLIVKEYSTVVADWMREIGSAKSSSGKKERSKKQLHTFGAIEYVVPGTRLYSELNVDTEKVGLGALGLLIHALTAFANKQGLGGWVRIGFGRFESQFDLITADNVRMPLLAKSESGYEPNVDAEQVAEALDAWAAASATINAAELEELYALPERKKAAA
jgi:CRISPR type IV-associated protein Csf2